jgi:hypothetical protein
MYSTIYSTFLCRKRRLTFIYVILNYRVIYRHKHARIIDFMKVVSDTFQLSSYENRIQHHALLYCNAALKDISARSQQYYNSSYQNLPQFSSDLKQWHLNYEPLAFKPQQLVPKLREQTRNLCSHSSVVEDTGLLASDAV